MPISFCPDRKKISTESFHNFYRPIKTILPKAPLLKSRGNRPLKMNFEDQLKNLIFFHLEEHVSARHMLQVLEEYDFARKNIAPKDGIKKSSFSEAINERGLKQMQFVFKKLAQQASDLLPDRHAGLGELVSIDGSLINAVLSMDWPDYRGKSEKARIHLGFNLNKALPSKIFFTNGKGAERPFAEKIISSGQTGVADRGYQKHSLFDSLQDEGKNFVIRTKSNTSKTMVQEYEVDSDGIVFYDAKVLLGSVQNNNQTQNPVRLVGYRVNKTDYWVATNREDLTAEQINELRASCSSTDLENFKEQKYNTLHAKT